MVTSVALLPLSVQFQAGKGRGPPADGGAMAPKKHWVQDAAWLRHTGDRLRRQREQMPRPFGKSTTAQARAKALALAQSEAARSSASAGGVPQVPGAKAPAGAVISATLQYHRFSEEGLTATGFEPQRQTVIVEGRPVQVACNPIA